MTSPEPTRAPAARLIAAIALALLAAQPAGAQPFVSSTSQVCTGTGAGECETGTLVLGRGAYADLSRAWDSPGFHYLAFTSITTDYDGFAGGSRASGTETPDGVAEFPYSLTRIARSFGSTSDTLTAGEGGAPGYFRLSFALTGSSAVSWQNGTAYTRISGTCFSRPPGTFTSLGPCSVPTLDFFDDAVVDTDFVIDFPIVLGSPFEYVATVFIEAGTGHAAFSPAPFQGIAEADYVGVLDAVRVLDAAKQPIPGAPVSVGASGFVYPAPEAAPMAAGGAALAALSFRTRRRAAPAR